jgi:hypothetical protein
MARVAISWTNSSRRTASLEPGGGFYSILEVNIRNFEKTIDNPKRIL